MRNVMRFSGARANAVLGRSPFALMRLTFATGNSHNFAILTWGEQDPVFIAKVMEKVREHGVVNRMRLYHHGTLPAPPAANETVKIETIALSKHDRPGETMLLDAFDLMHQKFDYFCLASSTQDLSEVAKQLKTRKKFVLGIGSKWADASTCNEFISLDSILPAKEEAPAPSVSSKETTLLQAPQPTDSNVSVAETKGSEGPAIATVESSSIQNGVAYQPTTMNAAEGSQSTVKDEKPLEQPSVPAESKPSVSSTESGTSPRQSVEESKPVVDIKDPSSQPPETLETNVLAESKSTIGSAQPSTDSYISKAEASQNIAAKETSHILADPQKDLDDKPAEEIRAPVEAKPSGSSSELDAQEQSAEDAKPSVVASVSEEPSASQSQPSQPPPSVTQAKEPSSQPPETAETHISAESKETIDTAQPPTESLDGKPAEEIHAPVEVKSSGLSNELGAQEQSPVKEKEDAKQSDAAAVSEESRASQSQPSQPPSSLVSEQPSKQEPSVAAEPSTQASESVVSKPSPVQNAEAAVSVSDTAELPLEVEKILSAKSTNDAESSDLRVTQSRLPAPVDPKQNRKRLAELVAQHKQEEAAPSTITDASSPTSKAPEPSPVQVPSASSTPLEASQVPRTDLPQKLEEQPSQAQLNVGPIASVEVVEKTPRDLLGDKLRSMGVDPDKPMQPKSQPQEKEKETPLAGDTKQPPTPTKEDLKELLGDRAQPSRRADVSVQATLKDSAAPATKSKKPERTVLKTTTALSEGKKEVRSDDALKQPVVPKKSEAISSSLPLVRPPLPPPPPPRASVASTTAKSPMPPPPPRFSVPEAKLSASKTTKQRKTSPSSKSPATSPAVAVTSLPFSLPPRPPRAGGGGGGSQGSGGGGPSRPTPPPPPPPPPPPRSQKARMAS